MIAMTIIIIRRRRIMIIIIIIIDTPVFVAATEGSQSSEAWELPDNINILTNIVVQCKIID